METTERLFETRMAPLKITLAPDLNNAILGCSLVASPMAGSLYKLKVKKIISVFSSIELAGLTPPDIFLLGSFR